MRSARTSVAQPDASSPPSSTGSRPSIAFPTAPEDCYAALLLARRRTPASLDVDPARVAVGGESAGGNLAAVVRSWRATGRPPLALQLLEVPVTDMGNARRRPPLGRALRRGLRPGSCRHGVLQRTHISGDPGDASSPYASPLLADDSPGSRRRTSSPPSTTCSATAARHTHDDSRRRASRRRSTAGSGTTHGSSALWQTWAPAREWMDEVVRVLESALHSAMPAGLGQVASS